MQQLGRLDGPLVHQTQTMAVVVRLVVHVVVVCCCCMVVLSRNTLSRLLSSMSIAHSVRASVGPADHNVVAAFGGSVSCAGGDCAGRG